MESLPENVQRVLESFVQGSEAAFGPDLLPSADVGQLIGTLPAPRLGSAALAC